MVWTGTFAKDVISVQLFGDLRKAFEKIRKDPHIGVSEIRRLYRATFSRPTQNELANSIQEMAYLPESLSLKFNSQFFKFHFQRVRRPSDGVREHELCQKISFCRLKLFGPESQCVHIMRPIMCCVALFPV